MAWGRLRRTEGSTSFRPCGKAIHSLRSLLASRALDYIRFAIVLMVLKSPSLRLLTFRQANNRDGFRRPWGFSNAGCIFR